MALIYLLLSFGTANATFWCQADEKTPHLELNPIGQCSSDAGDYRHGLKTLEAEAVSSLPGEDCLDSPVFTSTLPTSKPASLLNKTPADSFCPTNLPHILELSLEMRGLAKHSLSARLPEPHPLKALRTVVLLR
jgi:hypothetical protein